MIGRRSLGGFGRRRGGGSGKMRLVIGAVIALFSLASYYFVSDTNPFTGETQRISMSEQQELALGLNAAPQMVQQMGGAVPMSDPRAAEVERIGRILLEAGGVSEKLRKNDIPYEFSFTLIDDPQTVNAFALPGGPTFITTALYDRLENRAQLAGVVGHEIGHVVERHGAQRMHSSKLVQGLVSAGAIGLEDGSGRGLSAAQVGSLIGDVVLKGHSREHELESDQWGLSYLVQAGLDPREMVRVMEILRDASGGGRGGTPEFMQTHPHPESRIKAIEQYVQENLDDSSLSQLTDGGPLPR